MIIKLQAGESRLFPTAGRYLNVIAASDSFVISNSALGLSANAVKAGWIIDLDKYPSIDLENPTDKTLSIELQSSQLKINAAGGESVSISNKPVIQRIEESINVTAQATVENGTVHVVPGTNLHADQDKTIGTGSKVKLLAANPNRKSVLVQVISESRTRLRIGSSSVSAGRGVFIAGSITAPASMTIECSGDVYAFNESDETATVAVTEVSK